MTEMLIEKKVASNNMIYDNQSDEDEDNQHFFGQTGNNEENTPSYSDNSTLDNEKIEPTPVKNVKNVDTEIMRDLLGAKLLLSEQNQKKILNEIQILLGQITVNETKFTCFPVINLPIDKFKIEIPENLLNKGEFFTAFIDKKINTMNLIPENYEIENLAEFFNNLCAKNDSYKEIVKEIYEDLNCEKKVKIALEKIIKSLYAKASSAILDIVRNVKNKKKKSFNELLSLRLNTIINIHNEIYANYLIKNQINFSEKTEEEKKETYKMKFYEKNGEKFYQCAICHKMCISSQALGGHMSKNHPDQSEQYKKKKDIRNKREGDRNRLEEIKVKLFEKYKMDYIFMKENDKKVEIKRFLKEHFKEYFMIKQTYGR